MTENPNQPIEYRKWVYEQKKRDAERVHDQETASSDKLIEAALNNANIALRTAVLINGGAAVALLGFISSLYSTDNAAIAPKLSALTAPLMWFAWGVVAATIAMALAYFTNYSAAVHSVYKERQWAYPYLDDTPASEQWRWFAIGFQVLAVLAGLVSLAFFIYGMLQIRTAITALT